MGCGHGQSGLNQINNTIRPGAHKVFCTKFQKEMEGLDEIGQSADGSRCGNRKRTPLALVHHVDRALQHDIGRLPVVSRKNPQHMVGYFNRASLLGAWTRQIEDEGLREHGWIRKWRNSGRPTKQAAQAAEK